MILESSQDQSERRHRYLLFHQHQLQTGGNEAQTRPWSGVCCQRRAGEETEG